MYRIQRGVGQLHEELAQRLGPEVGAEAVEAGGALPLDDHQLREERRESVEHAEEPEEDAREEQVPAPSRKREVSIYLEREPNIGGTIVYIYIDWEPITGGKIVYT